MSQVPPTTDANALPEPVDPLLRRPAFWVYLIAVIPALAFTVQRLAATPADARITQVAWIGVVIQAGVLLLWGLLLLPRHRGRVSTVLLAVLIGLSFAPAAAILIMNAVESWGASRQIVGALVEEPLKAAAVVVVLVLLRSTLRGPLDGLRVGFFVGFGFAVVEDVLYTYGAADVQGAWVLVASRAITQLGGHALWTAIIGAALGYVILSAGRRWSVLLAAFTFSTLLHLTWNTSGVLAPGVVSLLVTAIVMAITIIGFLRVRRWSTGVEARAVGMPVAPARGVR